MNQSGSGGWEFCGELADHVAAAATLGLPSGSLEASLKVR